MSLRSKNALRSQNMQQREDTKLAKQTARIKKNSNYITVTIIVINTQNIELN